MSNAARKRLIEIVSEMSDEEVQIVLSVLEKGEYKRNRRRHQRLSYQVSVNCLSNGDIRQVALRDLSMGGVFIETNTSKYPYHVGQELILRVPFPDNPTYARIRGKIVRKTVEGLGISFTGKGIVAV